ncbi:aspartate aminotransferase family protein [Actinomadura atramentaria]|uniref:aspartate aminotransferase family protein n=1 Tax=Actinomadura atramentaria TaxID=1990 RepID=UPI0003678509|nr:aminotransferase class III-fold pyridoxal phosphate-dependent enzyme [Actinomadura atramentaria]
MDALLSGTVFDTVRDRVSPGLALGYKMLGRGAHEVAATGATVRLSDGRTMVDFGSYAVTLLGHRPAPVVAAVEAQLRTMPTATRALANPVVAGFVEDLVALTAAATPGTGPALDRVWLGSDGADAVEVATKLARRVTGRPRLLAVAGGFHGKTLGALALTHAPAFRAGLEPLLSSVTHLAPDDPDAVARETAAGDVAALVVEPVQGERGAHPLPPRVAERWAADARAAGAFLVSDEIQVGLRRCGEVSVALARGWRPDAVLFGKALGGGVMPLSGVVASAELHAPLAKDPTWHSATFGGHPLSCAAGRAALREIEDRAADGRAVGRAVERGLRELAARHPDVVTAVRGTGLLWALDCATPAVAGAVFTELAEHGLLVSPCLSAPGTIRLLPPMVATGAETDRAFDALDRACAAAAAYLGDG